MIIDARFIWEMYRPYHEGAALFEKLGGDPFEIGALEEKFLTETVPALNSKDWITPVRKELERRIKFAEDTLAEVYKKYEDPLVPFKDRRPLMEGRVPMVAEYLKEYISWREKVPVFLWEPLDVVDLKRDGVERFIRWRFDRFYKFAKTEKEIEEAAKRDDRLVREQYPMYFEAMEKIKSFNQQKNG